MSDEFKLNGDLIRELRKKKEWSGADMAPLVGVHPKYIYMIERNERIPDFPVILKIAEALGIPFSCLIIQTNSKIEPGYFRSGAIELDVPVDLVEIIIKLISSYNEQR